VKALVWGIDGDKGRRPATLAEAAAAGNMRPDTLRRWLHRPDMRAEMAVERKALFAWATSANAAALMDIRDNGENDAARVRAVLALEELHNPKQAPGVSVNVGIQTNVSGAATVIPGYVIRHKAEPPMIEGETDAG
jgi:hypothetical protein